MAEGMVDERRTYLGGPDVAAIVGLSPYLAPIDVWRYKVGDSEGVEQTERMRLGLMLEQVISDAYCAQTGRQVRRVGLVRHKTFPYLGGHPDRLIVGEPGILEAKASSRNYGDEVPPHVQVQVQWYMGLTGRAWCDVALLANMGLRIERVDADPELFGHLVTVAVAWWKQHVETGVEPPPDGTEAYRRHLAQKFPRSMDIELVATADQALLVEELRVAEAAKAGAELHVETLKNRLREAMGDAAVLVAPTGRITNKTEAPRVGWKDVAEAIAADAGVDVAEYAERDKAGREGPRVLRAWFPKAKEEKAA